MRDLGVKAKRPMPAMLVDGGLVGPNVEEFAEACLDDGANISGPGAHTH
jgi:hypothetical protein